MDRDSILDRSFHFDIDDHPQDFSRPQEFSLLQESPFRHDSEFPYLSRNISESFLGTHPDIAHLPLKLDDIRPGLGNEPLRLSILPQATDRSSDQPEDPEQSSKKHSNR